MLQKLNWEAHSNDDRNKTIEAVKDCLSSNDACILNFNMFSDLALSLSLEVEENKILALHLSLSKLVNLSDMEIVQINPNSKKEWLIFLNIAFGKGTRELKNKIPSVPG